MVALYVSFCFVTLQFFMFSVDRAFTVVAFCDSYLIIDWYLRINLLIYIDGVAVTDRRMLLKHWLNTRILWDVATLFPFEASGLRFRQA